jgi:hypothetical protein
MILRRLRPLLLASLAITLVPTYAADADAARPRKAASGKTSKGGGEAKKLLDAGTRHFKAGDYDRARGELDRAYKLSAQSGTLRMLAECNFKLNDFGVAYDQYEKLARGGAGVKKSDQAEAQRMLKTLETVTGQLEISGAPAGAEVLVDDRSVGKAPLMKPARVSPGPHKVRAVVDGTNVAQGDATAKAQETTPVRLASAGTDAAGDQKDAVSGARGKVSIEVTPAKATILIDGEEVGTGTYEGELPAGPHKLTVILVGYKNDAREITITEGEKATESVTLEAEEDGAPGEKPAEKGDGKGLFASAAAFGAFPIVGTVRLPTEGGNGTSSLQAGGGLSVHGGYSFGLIGVELGVAFIGDSHQERRAIPGETDPNNLDFQDGNIQRTDTTAINTLGGFAGIGPRLTTPGETFRFTVGADAGVSIRRFSLHRETGGSVLDSYKTSVTAANFAVTADASILIGKSPGLQFVAGVFVYADMASTTKTPSGDDRVLDVPTGTGGNTVQAVLPTPSYVMQSGPEIFIGPQLGVRFGL